MDRSQFKARDMSKNNKVVVLQTYFTNPHELTWMDGLKYLWEGKFNPNTGEFKVFVMNGYGSINSLFQTIIKIRLNLFRNIASGGIRKEICI